MDIIKFFGNLEEIISEIDNIVEELDKTEYIDKTQVNRLLMKVNKIMEVWLYFIRELRSEDEGLLIELYKDIVEAVIAEDRMRLTDALLFGLKDLICEYYMVLKEAVDE